jgi:hypothetical protein
MPKLKKSDAEGEKNIATFHPEIGDKITVVVPKSWTLIPLEYTLGKTPATVGQTARNERDNRKLKGRFVVHTIPQELEMGRGKAKKVYEFEVFAIEVKK